MSYENQFDWNAAGSFSQKWKTLNLKYILYTFILSILWVHYHMASYNFSLFGSTVSQTLHFETQFHDFHILRSA